MPTLDPDDWSAFRALAHRMVDDMLDHTASLGDTPVWQPLPEASRRALAEPVPFAGIGERAAYEAFLAHVLPYTNGNRHPRFFGWAQGNGTPLGMMADMLAAGINAHLAGFDQAPARVEEEVLRWLAALFGYPQSASGVLVLGGTMANVLALAVARHARAGFDVRGEGVGGGPRLVVIGTRETHAWLGKAVELLGLGRASLRLVATDGAGRMDVALARRAIEGAIARGERPIAIIGTAGTVATGALDDLDALADLADAQGVWLHVDAALGGLAAWSPRLRARVRGIERADSIALDLHKWMYQPFDVACVLVRDGAGHAAAFATEASYIAPHERGTIAGGLPFADRGIDLTRGFRALKVWMAMKAHGVARIVSCIERNVDDAAALGARIEAHAELELLAPVALNVVCFRYVAQGCRDLDALNRELLYRVQESGVAVPSSATIDGRFALRCALVNHRTRAEDLDLLLDAIVATGRSLARGG